MSAQLGRFAIGLLVAPALTSYAGAQAPPDPATVTRSEAGAVGLWQLCSGHIIWGMPRQADNRRHNVRFPGELQDRAGIPVLVREGFVIGHYEQTFTRNRQPMALNNSGDTVELLDANGALVNSVSYQNVPKGQVLRASDRRAATTACYGSHHHLIRQEKL